MKLKLLYYEIKITNYEIKIIKLECSSHEIKINKL